MSLPCRPPIRLTAAALLLAAGSAVAQGAAPPLLLQGMRSPALSPHALPHALSASPQDGVGTGETSLRAEPGAGADAPRSTLTLRESALSSARLVEMPAEVIPGRYTRPKYALGFRSSAMKSFANSMGLEADTCLLPLVRARTTISQDGDVGGRVMIFARCSFY